MKPQIKVVKNNLPGARNRLTQIQRDITTVGQPWARESSEEMGRQFAENLATQGRGGTGPELSPVTLHLYDLLGDPDGSGIRDHVVLKHDVFPDGSAQSRFGVRKGRPTMITRVQDQGVAIAVTPRMRAWRAAHGVPLKANTRYIIIPPRYSWSHAVRDTNKIAKLKLKRKIKQIHG